MITAAETIRLWEHLTDIHNAVQTELDCSLPSQTGYAELRKLHDAVLASRQRTIELGKAVGAKLYPNI